MHNSYETYDAHGNRVDEHSAFCTRCGAYIKHIYEFEGNPYGSTCIEVASGIRPDNWEWVEGIADEQATRKKLAEKEQERQELATLRETLELVIETTRKTNAAKFGELINVLKNASRYTGDFCWEMASTIEDARGSTKLDDIFSFNQLDIVREIWGKQTGGRKNSKAYKVAVVEFDAKFDS